MRWATDSLVIGVLMVTALAAFLMSLLAYLRGRTKRLLLISIALLIFVVKASIMITVTIFDGTFSYMDHSGLYLLFDIAVVALIMLSGIWE